MLETSAPFASFPAGPRGAGADGASSDSTLPLFGSGFGPAAGAGAFRRAIVLAR
jgi:hypothetical protein